MIVGIDQRTEILAVLVHDQELVGAIQMFVNAVGDVLGNGDVHQIVSFDVRFQFLVRSKTRIEGDLVIDGEVFRRWTVQFEFEKIFHR